MLRGDYNRPCEGSGGSVETQISEDGYWSGRSFAIEALPVWEVEHAKQTPTIKNLRNCSIPQITSSVLLDL